MWIFIILSIETFVIAVIIFLMANDLVEVLVIGVCGLLFNVLLVIIIGIPISAATTGLFPEYGRGERVGYIVKTSVEGVVWKTNEIQMQTGTGNITSIEGTYSFSVSSEEIFKEILALKGTATKVRVKYNQWLIMPYRFGKTDYNITGVEMVMR